MTDSETLHTFRYRARTEDGQLTRGRLTAPTRRQAINALTEDGVHVVGIREGRAWNIQLGKRHVSRGALMHFSRQLAAFVRAGVPILDALEVVEGETEDKILRGVLSDMLDSLRSGVRLADAAALHESVFPPFYVSILQSAEITGRLDEVLDRLAAYIERDMEARRKLESALVYPALILVFAVVAVSVLAGFVLPRFQSFFESFDAKLPLPTRILIHITDFIAAWGWLVGIVLVVSVVGAVAWFRSDRGRLMWDRLLLRTPVVGNVVRDAVAERFCRVLSSMVEAGVPLPEALQLSSAATNNIVFQNALAIARDEMMRGDGLAGPIGRTGVFPHAVTQMLRVGEETGTLADQLDAMASYFAQELDFRLKNLTTLFEPTVIVTVGLVVGFVAIALVSAMYGVYDQVDIQ
jgi:type IV pilus assembly protein PilC